MKPFFALGSALLLTGAVASTPEGLPGVYAAPSAQTLEHGRISVGFTAFGQNDASMIRHGYLVFTPGTLPGDTVDTVQIQDLVSAGFRLHLAAGLGGKFDIGLSLPIYSDLISDPAEAKKLNGIGLGDGKIVIKARAPLPSPVVTMGAALGLTIPSKAHRGFLPKGSELATPDTTGVGPNAATYSAGDFTKQGLVLFTLDLTKTQDEIPFRLNLSGGLLNEPSSVGGNRLQWNGSLEWLPAPTLGLFAAVAAQASLDHFKSFMEEDLRITGGVSFNSEDGFFVSGGVEVAVSSQPYYPYRKGFADGQVVDYETQALPKVALGLQVGWTGSFISKDTDGDGIPDKVDGCPKEKEDMDGFQDADGCPDPDNDDDSIPDLQDKCPNQAEDRDGIQDDDGCPETDADNDGIPDDDDKCPLEPEDRDGFQDMDGCPDLDNDQDGILDVQDKCPNDPEDKDGFEDEDGCPDPDNDKDGVPDSLDKCPLAPFPGTVDGCLATAKAAPVQEFPRQSMLRVRFQGLTASLTADSYNALDSLSDALKRDPKARVEIRAYTDDQGGKEKARVQLTQLRADGIRRYLIMRGLDNSRVTARGMGSQNSVASNRTQPGRQQNRRVEVVRVD